MLRDSAPPFDAQPRRDPHATDGDASPPHPSPSFPCAAQAWRTTRFRQPLGRFRHPLAAVATLDFGDDCQLLQLVTRIAAAGSFAQFLQQAYIEHSNMRDFVLCPVLTKLFNAVWRAHTLLLGRPAL